MGGDTTVSHRLTLGSRTSHSEHSRWIIRRSIIIIRLLSLSLHVPNSFISIVPLFSEDYPTLIAVIVQRKTKPIGELAFNRSHISIIKNPNKSVSSSSMAFERDDEVVNHFLLLFLSLEQRLNDQISRGPSWLPLLEPLESSTTSISVCVGGELRRAKSGCCLFRSHLSLNPWTQ